MAAMSPTEQVKAVGARLKELNPSFDGKVVPTIEDGVVTGLAFSTDHVTDVSPVRALTRLQTLNIQGSGWEKGSLADLSPLKGIFLSFLKLDYNKVWNLTPLKGMPLEYLSLWSWPGSDLTPLKGLPLKVLNCGGGEQRLDLTPLAGLPLESLCVNYTLVSDLAPLKGMPLTRLEASITKVSDLSPLRGMRLQMLTLENSKVSDLAPVMGMPLKYLDINGASVTDLSPLQDLPLKFIRCDFQATRDAKILRAIETLETINAKPVKEFWKAVEGQNEDQ